MLDLKDRCATESVVTHSNFLSADELSDAIKTERKYNEYVDTFYYGGYSEAERKVIVFVPKFYEVTEENFEDFINTEELNPLAVLKVKKDKFSKLTHRDYLGAIMGLGLKREVTGDIILSDDGCTLFCLKSIASYLTENLRQAGRGQLTVSMSRTSDCVLTEINTETVFVSVASLRLDCLVAAAFRLSRTSAVNAVNQGIVYVNSVQILKTDYQLKQGDKLVLRGKGKAYLDEIIRENKKGRIHINIKRYL